MFKMTVDPALLVGALIAFAILAGVIWFLSRPTVTITRVTPPKPADPESEPEIVPQPEVACTAWSNGLDPERIWQGPAPI